MRPNLSRLFTIPFAVSSHTRLLTTFCVFSCLTASAQEFWDLYYLPFPGALTFEAPEVADAMYFLSDGGAEIRQVSGPDALSGNAHLLIEDSTPDGQAAEGSITFRSISNLVSSMRIGLRYRSSESAEHSELVDYLEIRNPGDEWIHVVDLVSDGEVHDLAIDLSDYDLPFMRELEIRIVYTGNGGDNSSRLEIDDLRIWSSYSSLRAMFFTTPGGIREGDAEVPVRLWILPTMDTAATITFTPDVPGLIEFPESVEVPAETEWVDFNISAPENETFDLALQLVSIKANGNTSRSPKPSLPYVNNDPLVVESIEIPEVIDPLSEITIPVSLSPLSSSVIPIGAGFVSTANDLVTAGTIYYGDATDQHTYHLRIQESIPYQANTTLLFEMGFRENVVTEKNITVSQWKMLFEGTAEWVNSETPAGTLENAPMYVAGEPVRMTLTTDYPISEDVVLSLRTEPEGALTHTGDLTLPKLAQELELALDTQLDPSAGNPAEVTVYLENEILGSIEATFTLLSPEDVRYEMTDAQGGGFVYDYYSPLYQLTRTLPDGTSFEERGQTADLAMLDEGGTVVSVYEDVEMGPDGGVEVWNSLLPDVFRLQWELSSGEVLQTELFYRLRDLGEPPLSILDDTHRDRTLVVRQKEGTTTRELAVLNLDTLEFTHLLDLPATSEQFQISSTGQRLYYVNRNRIYYIELSSDTIVGPLTVSPDPHNPTTVQSIRVLPKSTDQLRVRFIDGSSALLEDGEMQGDFVSGDPDFYHGYMTPWGRIHENCLIDSETEEILAESIGGKDICFDPTTGKLVELQDGQLVVLSPPNTWEFRFPLLGRSYYTIRVLEKALVLGGRYVLPRAAIPHLRRGSSQAANLSLQIDALPRYAMDSGVSFDVVIQNQGPSLSSDPEVYVHLPMHWNVTSDNHADFRTANGQKHLLVRPGPIGQGGSKRFTITAQVEGPGANTFGAEVVGSGRDPSPQDNVVRAWAIVHTTAEADDGLIFPDTISDAEWDPFRQHLLLAVNADETGAPMQHILRINPLTGEMVGQLQLGIAADALSISSNGERVFYSSEAVSLVRQMDLDSGTWETVWSRSESDRFDSHIIDTVCVPGTVKEWLALEKHTYRLHHYDGSQFLEDPALVHNDSWNQEILIRPDLDRVYVQSDRGPRTNWIDWSDDRFAQDRATGQYTEPLLPTSNLAVSPDGKWVDPYTWEEVNTTGPAHAAVYWPLHDTVGLINGRDVRTYAPDGSLESTSADAIPEAAVDPDGQYQAWGMAGLLKRPSSSEGMTVVTQAGNLGGADVHDYALQAELDSASNSVRLTISNHGSSANSFSAWLYLSFERESTLSLSETPGTLVEQSPVHAILELDPIAPAASIELTATMQSAYAPNTFRAAIVAPGADLSPEDNLVAFETESPGASKQTLFRDLADWGDGWRYSAWFGWVNTELSEYYFHYDHNWIYVSGSSETAGFYFYDTLSKSWFWTNRGYYPYIYRTSGTPGWLRYLPDTRRPRWFYSFPEASWISD